MHARIMDGEISLEKAKAAMLEGMTDEELEKAVNDYTDLYDGTNLTADEIWEEIVCDSLGDMNIFSGTFEGIQRKTGELLRGTKKTANELRGERREQDGRAPPVEAKFSIQTLADEKKYVKVDVDQTQFDGLSEKEQRKLARRIIKKRYVGKVIGTIHQAYVNSRSADEYGHSANRRNVAADIKEAKMRVSTELENLMDVGTNYRTLPDGLYGHSHPRATGGYSYIDVLFEVGDTLYTGTINIENTNRGAVFKDLTQIRNATEGTSGSHEHSSSPTSQDDVSNKSISDSAGKSKPKTSRDLESLEELRRENRELRERARKWRRETTRTKQPEVRTEDVRKAAKALIRDMQSTVKAEEITGELQSLAEYMMRGEGKNERAPSWTEIKERAGAIAETLVDNAEALSENSDPELYRELKQYVRDTKMTIADRDKGDITYCPQAFFQASRSSPAKCPRSAASEPCFCAAPAERIADAAIAERSGSQACPHGLPP